MNQLEFTKYLLDKYIDQTSKTNEPNPRLVSQIKLLLDTNEIYLRKINEK